MIDNRNQPTRVGIADAAIIQDEGALITVGLGSCIGVVFYDRQKKIAALLHIMLPDSAQYTNVSNPYKFANLGVPRVLEEMVSKGANTRNIRTKIVGGASMFNFGDRKMTMDIGKKNAIAVKEALAKLNIPILAEEVGGSSGRTVIFELDTEKTQIRTVGQGIKEI